MYCFIANDIPGRQIVLILPILISIFYFNKKVLVVTSVIILCSVISLFIINRLFISEIKLIAVHELSFIILSILGTALAGHGIVNRGIELLKYITELIKSEETLIIEKSIIDKLSKTDALTGLYNHRTFHEYIDTILEQFNSHKIQLQLAIIDIDNFKKVNDTYGHWCGDIVLKEVARIAQQHISSDDFIARYGGEEFAMVFIGKSLDETLAVLEAIRDHISGTVFVELLNSTVTVSVGVHTYTENQGKEFLFKCADQCLYEAKATGKNKIVCS
jgi:diguanylate cyclase (GGDEF)-like protein